METKVVEGQNKPKRQKFQDMVEEKEEDRISALPDCLINEILSRLPCTEDAIRTATLSKQWKHIWTSVATLVFTHCRNKYAQKPNSVSNFVSFVDKTLTRCRPLKLKKFEVYTDYDIRFESQLNNWIRYAIRCNVEELELGFWFGAKAMFVLDQFFFTGSCFTDLRLDRCTLNPSGMISWRNLRSLCIFNGRLDEDLIENILFGSPLLETLELGDCYGYRRLDITSKSVKNFVLSGYYDPENEYHHNDIIEINAPNILSLTIQESLVLWKLLLLNVSSLIEADLDYTVNGYFKPICKEEEEEEEMLKGFILKLRPIKELTIGFFCSKVMSRLEAKGFNFPSNIKFPDDVPLVIQIGDAFK